tara:strand:- start:10592 stop:11806 length:1215 start_codon:yes stop_codon:yes gene_type:complete
MFINIYIKRTYRFILSYLIVFNLLFSCPLNFSENFFNDDIIGYYLSAVDINTGESNVLLFDYALEFGSDCELPTDVDIKFNIDVDIPSYTSGRVTLASGDFKLIPNLDFPDIRSFSFRNTDMSIDETYLPGGATLQGGDYTFDPVEGLSSAITSGGRLPNGRYYFRFYIDNCPDGFTCDSGIDKELNLFIPSYLNLISPGSSSINDTISNQVNIPYPVFQWNSDYCSNCSNYFIRICEFNPNIHSTIEDAINDVSILPIGSGYFDTGFSNGNIFQYPVTGFQSLNPGSIYVWKIKRSYFTTNGEMNDFSTSFIFKMKSDEPIGENLQNRSIPLVDEEKLIKIKILIGDLKFNEFFNQESGSLYNFNPSSGTIILNNEEISFDYLNELIELINSSNIEIIEVEIE